MNVALLNLAKKIVIDTILDSEKRAKLISIIMGIVLSIFLIPIMAISLPSILLKGDTSSTIDKNDYTFNSEVLENNKLYKEVKDIYLNYIDDYDAKYKANIEKIMKDYTYTIEVKTIDENGNELITEKEVIPQVIDNIKIDKPELRHIFAYLTTKYLDFQEMESEFKVKREEIINYLDSIIVVSESINGSDPIYYNVNAHIEDIDTIKNKYFTELEYGTDYLTRQDIFSVSYESMESINDDINSDIYNSFNIDELNIYANGMAIPHMLQYDAKWGSYNYGGSTIAKSGCAIVSMAMIESYLNNTPVSPITIGNWASERNYYVYGQGTKWTFFDDYPKTVGIKSENLGKDANKVIKALENGKPVVAIMSKGRFTSGGHFIVIRGITKEGKLLVNDSNDNFYSKNHHSKEFDFNSVYLESRNFWSFTVSN